MASSLNATPCLWTTLKSGNHGYLTSGSGFEVTCSKGNSGAEARRLHLGEWREEIKKEGGCPESAGDGKDGK